MKAAIYHHAEKGTSSEETAKQLKELEEFCKTRGFDEIERYDEKTESDGRQRPVFVQLMKDANRRKFDVVVVWSFRNFRKSTGIRDAKHIVALKDLGIGFVSYQEQFFDTLNSGSNTLVQTLRWLAEEDSKVVSDRMKLGIEKAKRQGTSIGRPKVQIDKQKAMEMQSRGMPLREIAQALGVSKETVRRSLMGSDPIGKTA
jgi:DNA invertase Pin-like site-specific DNA recombinase